ncbi:hypothetical protein [Acuticoccus sp. I52.16.1]|uniref:hypothetical protein n=1 Tax=Acuticoccus sp. I52.16.1 TaxID=2928472 RepID=UPI001FD17C08|nr:hypothetical protein [Acuticoccus sp. I52.16.1]UOM35584.1 hypothetical protein MRB58_05090 [Acuticoccus sp. I52.16.1]
MFDLATLTTVAPIVQVFVSLLSAVVWIAYLQIFLRQVVHQRRSQVLINLGASNTLDGRCFIANLGMEPVYVSDISLVMHDHDQYVATITDRTSSDSDDASDAPPKSGTYQGPLRAGEYMDIGSFRSMLDRAACASGRLDAPVDPANFGAFDIVAVASTAGNALISASVRTFGLYNDGDTWLVVPRRIDTTQIRSRGARLRLKRYLEMRMLAETTDHRLAHEDRRIQDVLPRSRLRPSTPHTRLGRLFQAG